MFGHQFAGNSLEEIWHDAMFELLQAGEEIAPRGFRTRELINCSFHLHNPRNRYIYNPVRKLNMAFGIAEFVWIMSGQDSVEMVSYYNNVMKRFSDDGVTLAGAYGKRLRGKPWHGHRWQSGHIDQFDLVKEKLRKDPDTRQALAIIWNPADDYAETKDVPCTVAFQFLIRNGALHMITTMRSNDIWLGTPYDIHQFTLIQEILAAELDVELGEYFHNVGSLHIYENNYELAIAALDYQDANAASPIVMEPEAEYEPDVLTRGQKHIEEIDALASFEETIRTRGFLTIDRINIHWEPYLMVFNIYRAMKKSDWPVAQFMLNRMKSDYPTHPLSFFMERAVLSKSLR